MTVKSGMIKLWLLGLLAAGALAGCATDYPSDERTVQPGAVQAGNPNDLEFLADIPSLKNVSMRMTEQQLVDILHQEKIPYTQKITSTRECAYYTHPKPHVLVVFGFVSGFCSGVQRLRD